MKYKEYYQREFHSKICILEELIVYAKEKALGSKAREEYGNLVSVVLRSLLCEELIEVTGFHKQLLFPLYSSFAALNILPYDYSLVEESVTANKAVLSVKKELCRENVIYCTYLDFEAWLYEAVIDFKDDSFPPLSRWDVVKLIANKKGAHYCIHEDERIEKVLFGDVMPFVIEGCKGEYTQSNLYTETIIGIAEELVFSFRHTLSCYPTKCAESAWFCYRQKYSYLKKSKAERFGKNKFIVCKSDVMNAYNANNYFRCDVTKKKLEEYFLFRDVGCKTSIITLDGF